MNPVLSQEEVAALFQELRERAADPSEPRPWATTAYPSRKPPRSRWRHLLRLHKITHWLTGFSELHWPQL